jgi:hypothetical protein
LNVLNIVKNCSNGNGAAINGRGVAHVKWRGRRVALAADVATGRRQFAPSLSQLSSLFDVSTADLRAELKAREARQRLLAERDERERQAAERWAIIQAEAEAVNVGADAIVTAWNTASPEAREAAVRTIGVADAWDVVAKVVA